MNKLSERHQKTLPALLALISMLMFSCKGEDRSHEYVELTAHNTWMFEVMQDKYLWGDLLQEQKYKSYFYTSTKFFSTLTSSVGQSDSWSYCLVDSAVTDPHARGYFNHLDSYGMDFTVITDPTKATSRSFARVTYVADSSPAAQIGITRNTFISVVDDTKLTSSNVSKYLVSGSSHQIVFHHIDTLDASTYIWTDTVEAVLPESRQVEEKAFPVAGIIQVESSNVAYLMSTRLVPYPDESQSSGSTYMEDLDTKIDRKSVV